MLAVVGCGDSDETTRKQPTPAATKAPAAAVRGTRGNVDKAIHPTPVRGIEGPPADKPGELTMKVQPDGTWEMYLVGSDPAEACAARLRARPASSKERAGRLTIGATVDCSQPAEHSFNIAADKVTFDPGAPATARRGLARRPGNAPPELPGAVAARPNPSGCDGSAADLRYSPRAGNGRRSPLPPHWSTTRP
jgi:hypothetical protein